MVLPWLFMNSYELVALQNHPSLLVSVPWETELWFESWTLPNTVFHCVWQEDITGKRVEAETAEVRVYILAASLIRAMGLGLHSLLTGSCALPLPSFIEADDTEFWSLSFLIVS